MATDHHTEGISVEWKDLCYSVKTKAGHKQILKNVSGFARPGTLTAILGASGAGKTSLLSVLAGRLGNLKGADLRGELLVNGVEADIRAQCAYVMQEPALFEFATAFETAEFASRLKQPATASLEEKRGLATETLKELGLGRVLETRVGGKFVQGLSGGERQRVGMACEILAAPGLILCDEPTSGLDSTQAFRVVESLAKLAKSGRTVIISIHQPRSAIFTLFDQVFLVAGGRTAYFGPAPDILDFFKDCGHECPERFNPADYALDITALDAANDDEKADEKAHSRAMAICDRAAETCNFTIPKSEGGQLAVPQKGPRAGWCEQFCALFNRSWREAKRNKIGNFVKTFQAILTALIVSALYSDMSDDMDAPSAAQDRTGLLFFMTISGLFGPLFGTIQTFSPEVGIVNRERAANMYNVSAYYLAKLLVCLPFDALPLVISGSIVYWSLALTHTAGRYLTFCAFYILMNLCSIGLAFFLSALANGRAAVAAGMVAPVAILLLFGGGFYLNVDSIPIWIRWISNISYLTFAYEGLVVNEFESRDGGDQIIRDMGFEEGTVGTNLIFLTIIALSHHFAAFTVMSLKGPKYQPILKHDNKHITEVKTHVEEETHHVEEKKVVVEPTEIV